MFPLYIASLLIFPYCDKTLESPNLCNCSNLRLFVLFEVNAQISMENVAVMAEVYNLFVSRLRLKANWTLHEKTGFISRDTNTAVISAEGHLSRAFTPC